MLKFLTCPRKPPRVRPTCPRNPSSRSCQWTSKRRKHYQMCALVNSKRRKQTLFKRTDVCSCGLTLSSCTRDTWSGPWQDRAQRADVCKSTAASTLSRQTLSCRCNKLLRKGLFVAWLLASSWGRPGLFLLAFETCRHSRHTCNRPREVIKVNIVAAKIHLWAGCLPKSPVLQLYQFVLSIQVVAKAARKSPKSLTEMLIIWCYL